MSNERQIPVSSMKKKVSYNYLLTDCNIGLSTVLLEKQIISENLFPPLKTKEDYTAWLKLTKNNLDAYNFPEYLAVWNYSEDSLSSNFKQKFIDGFRVYHNYMKFNKVKSKYYLFLLAINSIKRKF